MTLALVAGLLAGVAMGVVLHRGQLCFHSMFAGAWTGRTMLLQGWALGVSIAAVGLAVLYLLPWSDGLNRGLAFRPVAAIVGGLLIGAGMVVAQSCVSGLFYKLGSGMLGATVGLLGWGLGELAAREIEIPGPTVLSGGVDGTIPGILGLPRALVAGVLLGGVVVALSRASWGSKPTAGWQWGVARLGAGLGAAIILGWVLARVGGVSFGPSSVGAVAGAVAGSPNWWLIAFLVGITLGALVSARSGADFWVRGESRVRYVQLFLGGLLLGAGGWVAGGCNIGHGLSGVAQLNVSSFVVVAAMAVGVRLAIALRSGTFPLVRAGRALRNS